MSDPMTLNNGWGISGGTSNADNYLEDAQQFLQDSQLGDLDPLSDDSMQLSIDSDAAKKSDFATIGQNTARSLADDKKNGSHAYDKNTSESLLTERMVESYDDKHTDQDLKLRDKWGIDGKDGKTAKGDASQVTQDLTKIINKTKDGDVGGLDQLYMQASIDATAKANESGISSDDKKKYEKIATDTQNDARSLNRGKDKVDQDEKNNKADYDFEGAKKDIEDSLKAIGGSD